MSGDGIVYEQGRNPKKIRAVVMRRGIRVISNWRNTKEAALRNLVVKLAHRIGDLEENPLIDTDFGDYVSRNSVSRDELADLIDAIAKAMFINARVGYDTDHLDPIHLDVLDPRRKPLFDSGTPVSQSQIMMRGAHTLRWVHRREETLT